MSTERRVVIHQPDFAPYLGFFHRFLRADLYIVLDHVQFSKGGWHNRDKIKTPEGVKWLTVPVSLRGRHLPRIVDVQTNAQLPWREQHLAQLRRCYRDAPYFEEVMPHLERLYAHDGVDITSFNLNLLRWLTAAFDVETPWVRSSTLAPQGSGNEMLVDLLGKVEATTYISGIGARGYYRPEPFADRGIPVAWQEFRHPVYRQLHGEFVPELSSLDVLFNCGLATSRDLLRS